MDLNKGISTPIAILLIIAFSAVTGIVVWQLAKPAEQPTPKQPSDYTTQADCEEADYYWYDNACHKEQRNKAWQCGEVVTYKEENYDTIKVGNQCWFADNLNVGQLIDADVPAEGWAKGGTHARTKEGKEQTNNGVIEKYCYNNKKENCDVYGGLYQWNEAMQYNDKEGAQGICPDGWHIPTDSEWVMLENYLAGSDLSKKASEGGFNYKAIGAIMAGNNSLWEEGDLIESPEFGKSGLDIIPAGLHDKHYYHTGAGTLGFKNKGEEATLWSSSNANENFAWYRHIQKGYRRVQEGNTELHRNYVNKNYAHSVRCLKDPKQSMAEMPERITDSSNWETYEQDGIRFKYPSKLGDYIEEVEWPPKVTIETADNGWNCEEEQGNISKKQFAVGGKQFCVKIIHTVYPPKIESVDRNEVWTRYKYKTQKDGKQITLITGFTFENPGCPSYKQEPEKPSEYKKCVQEQDNFNSLIHKVLSTLEFTE